jgi:hypothetical protein
MLGAARLPRRKKLAFMKFLPYGNFYFHIFRGNAAGVPQTNEEE